MSADPQALAALKELINATLSNPAKDSLTFGGSALAVIPDDVATLAERLTILDMSKNRIATLPSGLSRFTLLATLKLRGNALVNIVEGVFGSLRSLKDLDLTDNELESLPADLGALGPSLERLALTSNNLTALPDSITQLVNLRELLIGENQLTALPEAINNLTRLDKLEAHENKLVALPANIVLCTKLRTLSVQHNEITALPDKMWLLEHLTSLHLYENQFDENVVPNNLLVKRAKAILNYLRAISEGRNDDAKEILDHALSVPVKQKSQGKIALTRGTSIVASDKPALLRQPSVSQSSTGAVVGGGSKAPPSPRGGASDGTGAVASEIPSGIVSRASMSLRRASTINAQDDKAIVSRPPRPANPSVLARAPSQVTEAAAVASGSPTGSLLLKRPTSVAAPLSPSHSAKLGPKAPPRPRPNNATPTAHVKQASTGNTSDTASDEQEARSGSVPIDSGSNPVSPKEKILNGDAHATVQAKSNVDANGTANAKVAPNGISTASDPHTPAAATPNGSAHANGTDTASAEAVSVETSKNAGDGAQVESPAVAQEMSFDVLQDHPTSLITRPSVANLFVEVKSTPKLEAPPPKVSVEPTSAPDSATRPTHEAESDTDSKASGMTARLTVEDAKPLILRQKSSLDETDDFVFDAPKPVFIDDEPAPTAEPVPASDPVSDPVSEPVSDPATPKAPKKSSKKNKQSAEAVESATASGNMEDSDPAVRVRAKTRRILGAESSVGTPFYGASDIAYLPRRFTQVPLMRVDSKRYLLESNGSQKTWKDMFSPDNLTLLPSGTISGYSDFIAREEHLNFVGEDKVDGGVVVISMLKRAAEDTDINCIVRTKNGDHSLLVPIPDKKPKDSSGWVSLLRKNAEISAIVEKRIALKMVTDPAFVADLEEVESKLDRKTYKFGIVYCKEGQKEEEEFLSNTQASEDFEEFIDWLGARISLQGWNKYDGGLDTKKNGTGEFSIFAEWKHIQMMFHVSTLMPAEGPADEWIQEKKVHIGNDVVVIVFMEGETAETVFNPKKFVSQFNHAFIVINPIRQKGVTLYRVNTVYKNGVKPCVPELPPDCIFERSDIFRYLLYTKLINSERSAFASVEQFSTSMANSRFHQLYNLGMKYAPAKEGGCLAGCSGKK